MTRDQFACECGERLIPIEVALENDAIVAALKLRDDDAVREVLDNQF